MDPLSSFTTLLEGKVTTKMSDCFIYRGNFSAFTFGNVFGKESTSKCNITHKV